MLGAQPLVIIKVEGCLSVCLKLKISVTAEAISLYSSENIPTDPVMVSSYFLGREGGGYTHNSPPPKKKYPHPKFDLPFLFKSKIRKIWLIKPFGLKPLEVGGEGTSQLLFNCRNP